MARGKEVEAITSFACEVDGKERLIRQGEVLPANSPVVKGREDLFEQQQAIAAPRKKVSRKTTHQKSTRK
jgi:hypothetical protein